MCDMLAQIPGDLDTVLRHVGPEPPMIQGLDVQTVRACIGGVLHYAQHRLGVGVDCSRLVGLTPHHVLAGFREVSHRASTRGGVPSRLTGLGLRHVRAAFGGVHTSL
jgi:hypothetical protein